MTDDEYLFDMTIRHQLYVEQVKRHMTREFNKTLTEIANKIRERFARVTKDNMRDLTQNEIRSIVSGIRAGEAKAYKDHTAELMAGLLAFTQADRSTVNDMYGRVVSPRPAIPAADDLWAKAKNDRLPSTGELMTGFVGALAVNAMDLIRREIYKGHANNLTVRQTKNNILGTKSNNYRDGLFTRFMNWHKAVVSTSIGHISATVQFALGSLFFERYQWASIIDSVTSELCEARNGRIYRYGDGPRPPAHVNCRSSIVPFIEAAMQDMPTLGAWMKRQPQAFVNDVAKPRALTLKGFGTKTRLITAR